MAAILRDSVVVVVVVVVVAVVRTRPRTIPLAMITMRKSIHGFPFLDPFLPYMGMGLRRSSANNIIAYQEPLKATHTNPEIFKVIFKPIKLATIEKY